MVSSWRSLLCLGLGLVLLSLMVRLSDPGEVLDAVSGADYYRLTLPAVCLYFLSLHCRAVRWRFLLSPVLPVSSRDLFPLVCVGFLVNNVLPVRLGELARAMMLSRMRPVRAGFSLGAVAVERAYDALFLFSLGPLMILFLLFRGDLDSRAFLLGLALPVLLLGLLAICLLLALGGSCHARWVALSLLGFFPRRPEAQGRPGVAQFPGGDIPVGISPFPPGPVAVHPSGLAPGGWGVFPGGPCLRAGRGDRFAGGAGGVGPAGDLGLEPGGGDAGDGGRHRGL